MGVWNTRRVDFTNSESDLYAKPHIAKVMGGSVDQPSLCQIGSTSVIHRYLGRECRIYLKKLMGIYSASTCCPAPTLRISSTSILGDA